MFTVYKIYNNIENKVYIGCTNDYNQRVRDHLTNDRFSSIKHLFDNLPKESFEFSILHANIESKEDAYSIEKQEIINHNSVENGYNNCYYQGFGGSVDASAAGRSAWEEGSHSRELLLEERRTRFLDEETYKKFCEAHNTEESRNNKSRGVSAYYASTDPVIKSQIKGMRDKIQKSLNTEECIKLKRESSQIYSLKKISLLKYLHINYPKISKISLSCSLDIGYSTVKDILTSNRYYCDVVPSDELMFAVSVVDNVLIVNKEMLDESNKQEA